MAITMERGRASKFETPGDEPNIKVSMVDDSPTLNQRNLASSIMLLYAS
jgi:hypothetical protein